MTLPTVFSDLCTYPDSDTDAIPQQSRTDGVPHCVSASYTVVSGTAGDTVIGMIRLHKGTRVMLQTIYSADLDSGSAITLDVGVTYDDSDLSGSESVDGFADGLGITNHATQRTYVWPVANDAEAYQDGDFVAAGDGYIAYKILDSGSGGTTTEGAVKCTALISEFQT